MIERQNILDLIGNYKGRYSSCVITSYTFDFVFFEERIMSILRSANVKNVNVFIDGNYLDQYLENTSGSEFKTHKTYSLNPIYETGIFHPKIMLLTGPKHGLLVIGSGNLTSSGLSSNDEIWGAFHLDSIDSQNAPVFASVWQYLQTYLKQAKGFNAQKIAWITERSPWINEITPIASESFLNFNHHFELKFVGNTGAKSSYNQLIDTLPKTNIKKLTIISPYFDNQGLVLNQITSDLTIGEIICITDSEFGILPNKLNDQLYQRIKFYDWKDCLENFDKRNGRLHAKIFHFEYENGLEYIYVGSANATINGFGSKTVKASNAEAGLIIKRNFNKGYLHELGISVKKAKTIDVKSFVRKVNNIGDTLKEIVRHEQKIAYSEINGNKLTLYFKEQIIASLEIVILDSEGVIIEKLPIDDPNIVFVVHLANESRAHKVCLFKNNSRVSNKCLIHNIAYQAKCNPDPNQAALTEIIESLLVDPENGQLINLLALSDYNLDEEEIIDFTKSSHQQSPKIKKETKIDNYQKLSENEFNQIKLGQQPQTDLLNNPNVQIADLLEILSKRLHYSNKRIIESNEESLAKEGENNQTGAGNEIQQSFSHQPVGDLEAKAILKHLAKVNTIYSEQLLKLHKSQSLNSIPRKALTLKDLSIISNCIQLMYIFYGKKYKTKKAEIVLNFDRISIEQAILSGLNTNSLQCAIDFYSEYETITEKSKNKEFIINYFKQNKNEIIIALLKELEDMFGLVKINRANQDNRNLIYYKIAPALVKEFEEKKYSIYPSLLLKQKEYDLTTEYNDYMPQGIYNHEHRHGIKLHLIELLGSFLILANSGYKNYEHELFNEESLKFRNRIFEYATFLCLNINWLDREIKYRDILLLDLFHTVSPLKTDASIEKLKISLEGLYLKSNEQNPKYEENLNYYFEKLITKYKFSSNAYSLEISDPLKFIKSSALNTYVLNREIGFGSIFNVGREFIMIEKPGLYYDKKNKANVLKLKYPGSLVRSVNN